MQDMGRDAGSSSGTVVTATASTASTSSTQFTTQSFWADSDFETEPDDLSEWRHAIDQEELRKLNPREMRRQDIINGIFRLRPIFRLLCSIKKKIAEIFTTEKSHVRNLKVLDRLFLRPLKESNAMPKESVEVLFPNLEALLELHTQYNQKMKERAKAGFPVGNIGDMLCEMVMIKISQYHSGKY